MAESIFFAISILKITAFPLPPDFDIFVASSFHLANILSSLQYLQFFLVPLQLPLRAPHAPGPDVPDVLEAQLGDAAALGDLVHLVGNVLLERNSKGCVAEKVKGCVIANL